VRNVREGLAGLPRVQGLGMGHVRVARYDARSMNHKEVSLQRHAAPVQLGAWLARLGRVFPRSRAIEAATTVIELPVTPAEAWSRIAFYEEVPQRPSAVLRLFLPLPVRTEGDKMREGALVQCTYDSGHLTKRITQVTPPHRITFDVLDQHLGIEDSVTMTGGTYAIAAMGAGCTVTLTTRYKGHLQPRWLWRPLEGYLARLVHLHIVGLR
jgi:hypothetical protein